MARILITGTRVSGKEVEICAYLNKYIDPSDTIIHGGAWGVDRVASAWAIRHGIKTETHRPDYVLFGNRAPLIRNDEMLKVCDTVVAIWDGKSRGTGYTITKAKGMKIPTVVLPLS